jgi:2-isopropylmalate synthase
VVYKAREFGIELNPKDAVVKKIVDEVKDLESKGYEFEGAEASFEILVRRALKTYRPFFKLTEFRVIDEKTEKGPRAEATVKIAVDGVEEHKVAEGSGPVNALDRALRRALERFYPAIKEVELVDYKVRVLPAGLGTASQVRVLIESRDKTGKLGSWGTVGVSENIIEASWQALVDSLEYKLLK